jgi:predicted enzyme related to lactoylglutathione lyase
MDSHGTVWWTELNTFQPARARAFYAALLGWEFDEMPMPGGTYLVARKDDEMVAGIFDMKAGGMPADTPSHWFTYIAVDDVDVRVRQVVTEGGKVLREPWDIPGVGRVAIIMDAAGAGVGLMTPAATN